MDSSKCQTSAVSPAEPGDFSFLVNMINAGFSDKGLAPHKFMLILGVDNAINPDGFGKRWPPSILTVPDFQSLSSIGSKMELSQIIETQRGFAAASSIEAPPL